MASFQAQLKCHLEHKKTGQSVSLSVGQKCPKRSQMSYCQNVVGGAGQGLGGVWRGRWGGRGGGKDEKKEEGEEVKSSKGGGNEVDELKRKKRSKKMMTSKKRHRKGKIYS